MTAGIGGARACARAAIAPRAADDDACQCAVRCIVRSDRDSGVPFAGFGRRRSVSNIADVHLRRGGRSGARHVGVSRIAAAVSGAHAILIGRAAVHAVISERGNVDIGVANRGPIHSVERTFKLEARFVAGVIRPSHIDLTRAARRCRQVRRCGRRCRRYVIGAEVKMIHIQRIQRCAVGGAVRIHHTDVNRAACRGRQRERLSVAVSRRRHNEHRRVIDVVGRISELEVVIVSGRRFPNVRVERYAKTCGD